MKIEFEIGTDNQEVLIKSNGKEIGHIFTPASSGNDIVNAIQICGFEEAYDFWGCGIFGEKVKYNEPLTKERREWIKKMIASDALFMREASPFYEDILSKGYEVKTRVVMKKDIQLLFKDYDKDRMGYGQMSECICCFNNPCTCEQETSKTESPYTVKRAVELEEKGIIWKKIPENKPKKKEQI